MNKSDYRLQCSEFLRLKATEEGVKHLPGGILYRVIESGDDTATPNARSVVTVHYTGSLINGTVFDDSRSRSCPEAFRVYEVIEGWQIALQQMHKGDRWEIYIPYKLGYGARRCDDIPAYSTLIFDVSLINIV